MAKSIKSIGSDSMSDIELASHLMRRAGFGLRHEELLELVKNPYEAIVDNLLSETDASWLGDYMVRRFDNEASGMINVPGTARTWIYRMISTSNPLQEKMPLLWHGIFATGIPKVINGRVLFDQINMFRKHGLGKFDELLIHLAKDPAMIVWLDNQENHKDSINENWGRELLELFSMGVGNYTEEDVKECARAFTGWTIGNTDYMMTRAKRDSDWPYGRIAYHFEYKDDDHDDSTRTFLGETGHFNGEDIIRIICKQESTARFLSRHLYHFFVTDEVPVPSWQDIEPKDPEAIDILVKAYFDSDYDLKEMLRVLFNSEFFKSEKIRYKKVKGPAEFAAGVLRLSKEFDVPTRDLIPRHRQIGWMGQELSNPTSVEGWHEGQEWIDTGALVERINFASEFLGNKENNGVKQIIKNIESSSSGHLTSAEIVSACLLELGDLLIDQSTYDALVEFSDSVEGVSEKISGVLGLIGSTKEFQMA